MTVGVSEGKIRVVVRFGFVDQTCGDSFNFPSSSTKVRSSAAMLGLGDPVASASAEGARPQGLGIVTLGLGIGLELAIPGRSSVTAAAEDADFSSSLESSSTTICIRVNDDGGSSDSVTFVVVAVIDSVGVCFSFCSSHT